MVETAAAPTAEGAVAKRIAGRIGPPSRNSGAASGPDAPTINLTLYTPANIAARVPIVLMINFGAGRAQPAAAGRGRDPGGPSVAGPR